MEKARRSLSIAVSDKPGKEAGRSGCREGPASQSYHRHAPRFGYWSSGKVHVATIWAAYWWSHSSSRGIRSGTPPLSGLRRMDPNVCAFFDCLVHDGGGIASRCFGRELGTTQMGLAGGVSRRFLSLEFGQSAMFHVGPGSKRERQEKAPDEGSRMRGSPPALWCCPRHWLLTTPKTTAAWATSNSFPPPEPGHLGGRSRQTRRSVLCSRAVFTDLAACETIGAWTTAHAEVGGLPPVRSSRTA